MDYVKQLYAQLRDLFLSMTPGNRIIASMLAAVIVVSLGYLVVGSIKTDVTPEGKYAYVYDDRPFVGDEKSSAENALARAGLRGHDWIGDKLRVPRNQLAKYTAVIAENKVLNPRGNARKEAVDGAGPWESGKMLDNKKEQATARDLANAIAMLPDVATAQVFPSSRRDFNRQTLQHRWIPSASVLVEAKTNKPLSDDAVASIAAIVAPAFGIVDLKEITITDSKNVRTYNGLGQERSRGGTSYHSAQTRYQDQIKDQIHELFPYIRGLQVQATVVLSSRINENVFIVQHDDPTAVHTHERGTDFEKTDADRFARPGQIAQMSRTLIDPGANVSAQARTKEITHEKEESNALQGTENRHELAPFIPQRIVASLQIPRSYVKEVWQMRNRTAQEPTEEELDVVSTVIRDDMKKQVEHLLFPYRDPRNPETVQITEYPDDPPEEIILTAWEQFQLWLFDNWQTLGLMGLVLSGLGVLWLITRPEKPEPIVIYEAPEVPLELLEARARAEAEAAAAAAEEEIGEDGIPRTLEPFKSMLSLQEEIAELVEQNPDAAAAVLRQWIGNVANVEK